MIEIAKNKNIQFFLKVLLFCVILFSLDFGVGSILRLYYFKQESGLQYRTTYSIDSTKADILIFGASRANHHYHPQVFESKLGGTFYNVGRDGTYIIYHYAVLKAILKRHTPKVVILDIKYGEFAENIDSYDRLSSLLPYYESHPEMRPLIELRGKYERVKLFSKTYPFNSLLTTIFVGNLNFNKARKSDIKGYIPLFKEWSKSLELDTNLNDYLLDSTKIRIFESFLRDCKNSNINLIVAVSPYYEKYKYPDPSMVKAHDLCRELNIKFLDFSQDSSFLNNRNYFQDISHLNDKGAIIFSRMIIDSVYKGKF